MGPVIILGMFPGGKFPPGNFANYGNQNLGLPLKIETTYIIAR